MSNIDRIAQRVLQTLLVDFRNRKLTIEALASGYPGPSLAALRVKAGEKHAVEFDLAIKGLEERDLVDTGPKVPHENDPYDAVYIIGLMSKREYVYLTEKGYREAQSGSASRPSSENSAPGGPTSYKAGHRTYVNLNRIQALNTLPTGTFDFSKLVRLTEEVNSASANGNHLSVAMLVRAIIDHIPPLFGCTSVSEIEGKYVGSRSFKETMKHLNGSSRKIADQYLHGQIRSSESLPNETQVDFSNDLDVLLAEIERVYR